MYFKPFFINREKLKNIIKLTKKVESKINTHLSIVYVAFLMFFVGITITLLSLNSNQTARILIEDSTNVPVEIELRNKINPIIYIKIRNSEEEFFVDNSNVVYSESYVEVLEKNEELKSSNDIEHFVRNLSKEHDKVNVSKTEYTQIYSVDLGDYLASGGNYVEIIIVSTVFNNTKAIHFLTTVTKEGDKIKVIKKKMNLKL